MNVECPTIDTRGGLFYTFYSLENLRFWICVQRGYIWCFFFFFLIDERGEIQCWLGGSMNSL